MALTGPQPLCRSAGLRYTSYMPAAPPAPWTSFALDPASPEGIQDQIANYVRFAILHGALRPGAAVPSTRVLARDLGIARQTAVLAYARLAVEGYLTGKPGSATRVPAVLPEDLLHAARGGTGMARTARPVAPVPLSRRGTVKARLRSRRPAPGPPFSRRVSRRWTSSRTGFGRGSPGKLGGAARLGCWAMASRAATAHCGRPSPPTLPPCEALPATRARW